MPINAGQLRHRVKLQRLTQAATAQRATDTDWRTLAEVWAKVEPLGGREALLAMQVDASLSHRVTIRYWPDLQVKDRVLFGTRALNIVSIQNPEERDRELILLCEEPVA